MKNLSLLAALLVAAIVLPVKAKAFAPTFHWYQCGTSCLTHRYQSFLGTLLKAQAINAALFFGMAFLLGLLVRFRDWKVGYTRKILAGILYVAPFFYGYWWPFLFEARWTGYVALSITATCLVFALCIATMCTPIRTRSTFFATAFASIDRPEDQPLTITWLISSVFAMWVVLMIWQFSDTFALHYVMLALFISGVGDALAEPVGLKFGRHKYSVRAIGTNKRYTRSIEGSACVFLSAIVGLIWVDNITYGFRNASEYYLALLLIPIVVTIAEAKSPHSWDQTFIVGCCGLTASTITWLI